MENSPCFLLFNSAPRSIPEVTGGGVDLELIFRTVVVDITFVNHLSVIIIQLYAQILLTGSLHLCRGGRMPPPAYCRVQVLMRCPC